MTKKPPIKNLVTPLTDAEKLAELHLERKERQVLAFVKEVGVKKAAYHYLKDPEDFADYVQKLLNKYDDDEVENLRDPDF